MPTMSKSGPIAAAFAAGAVSGILLLKIWNEWKEQKTRKHGACGHPSFICSLSSDLVLTCFVSL